VRSVVKAAIRSVALLTVMVGCFGSFGTHLAVAAGGGAPKVLRLRGDIRPVHDPTIIRENDTYYVFATNEFAGALVPMFCSRDLREWTFCGNVFDGVPDWALDEVPGASGIWAPDISFAQGRFRLYYSVSTFGSNRSVVGLITNATLDPNSPDYRWIDEGKVLGSTPQDDFNAIDPNAVMDADGAMWLAFGSFWTGIKMRKLDAATGKLAVDDATTYSLASRPPPGSTAIEAPFIVREGEYYYLFVSFDLCCRGVESTYNIRVGRSRSITGPYVDKKGRPMLEGGGTVVVRGTGSWRGPGHAAVLRDADADYLAFHAYDGATGVPTLQISTLSWKKGWPRAGVLPQ
jgi:arabinan endo-1,5-alpha-L-arabinosidase